MRLFRQLRDASDWQAVVDDIASALAAKVTGSPEPVRAPPPAASPPPAETALRPAILTDSPQEPSMTRPALRPAAFL